eukprot:g1078.t1
MISKLVGTRSTVQCRQRWQKVLKPGLRKGQWNDSEDALLRSLVKSNGTTWAVIAEKVPGRTPKQCRERWKHHLDPRIKKSEWTEAEDRIIMAQHNKLGNKWSKIAKMLEGRTANAVKIRRQTLARREEKRKNVTLGKTPKITPRTQRRRRLKENPPEPESFPFFPPPSQDFMNFKKDFVDTRHMFNPTPLAASNSGRSSQEGEFKSSAYFPIEDFDTGDAMDISTESLKQLGLLNPSNSNSSIAMNTLPISDTSVPIPPSSMMRGYSNNSLRDDSTRMEEDITLAPTMPVPMPPLRSLNRNPPVRRRSSSSKSLTNEMRVTSGDLLELEGYISKDLSDTIKNLELREHDFNLLGNSVSGNGSSLLDSNGSMGNLMK